MEPDKEKPKKRSNRIPLAIVLISIGIAIFLYMYLIGFGSNSRDDDVSLNKIDQVSQDGPVVLFFWGEGCAPCTEQKPVMEDLEKDYNNENVTFYWFDSNKHGDLTDHYDIYGVPTTIILNQQGIIKKFEGFYDYDSISKYIDESITSY